MKRYFFFFLFVILLFSCREASLITLRGFIFGTSYQIKYIADNPNLQKEISQKITKELTQLNDIFSTYTKNSELSKINAFSNLHRKIKISSKLYEVLFLAKQIFHFTDGFFDVTVHPLIQLWGFEKKKFIFPSKQKLKEVKKKVDGNAYVLQRKLNDSWFIKKKNISIDLSSIAKGYAVDKIKELLHKEKITNCLIEIGGEMFASGRKLSQKWQVGIVHPNKKEIAKVVSLQNRGMATSGNYENFFITNKILYSHILNPKTGYPIKTSLCSVTVFAESCMLADALATALLAMGNNAFSFAKKNNLSVFCVFEKEGKYQYFSNSLVEE